MTFLIKHLTNIYRTFQPSTAEYIVFSNAQGTISEMYLTLGHKVILSILLKNPHDPLYLIIVE